MVKPHIPEVIASRLPGENAPGVISVVTLNGVIASGGAGLGGRNINVETTEHQLEKAFTAKGVKAVALSINSPGGSPTQCELIGARIRQLAAEHELPVLAFCEDAAASGGYWLACAADEIFAAATSMIGSVGVVSSGFGVKDLAAKLGVERRIHTAGEAKVRLDSFTDEKPEDVEWLEQMQGEIHTEFANWVLERRGGKLTVDASELFTGEVWLGRKAVELGLIDGIGTLRGVLAQRYPDAKIRAASAPKALLARLGLPGAGVIAEQHISAALGAINARALWSRFGL
jgi:serine protease SohB